MKILKLVLFCLFSVTSLSGCLPHTELDEQAIVEAVGIDYADGEYEVTVQYFNMEGTGGSSPIDSTKANVVNISGKGESVSTALNSASVKCGKSFMYGITSVIVMGREALKQDILKTLSFAESYYQSNTSVLVAAADGKASDILAVKFKDGIISIEHLKMLLNNSQSYGLIGNVTVIELLREQRRSYAGTILPVLSVSDGGETTDDGKNVLLTGGMLLSGKRYISDISLSDMSGIQLLRKNPQNTLVSVDSDNEKVSVTIYNIKAEIKHSFSEGKLRFEIDMRADGKYTDSQLVDKDLTFSSKIEAMCAEALNNRIQKALSTTVTASGCDSCGLKYRISSSDYRLWRSISENFGDFLKEAEFSISTDIDIDRFGIIH